jgi:hypothetical protein
MVVMLSQQLSGINILAFLASVFFTAAKLTTPTSESEAIKRNLGLTIGFGAANAIFSAVAYFWIEPLPSNSSMDEAFPFGDTPPAGHRKEEGIIRQATEATLWSTQIADAVFRERHSYTVHLDFLITSSPGKPEEIRSCNRLCLPIYHVLLARQVSLGRLLTHISYAD